MSLSILIAGMLTGLLLGVFGSGGSIITTPALLYLLEVEPKSAIAMSLGIVAITATVTAAQHWRKGHVNLKVTAVFGAFGAAGTYLGARLGVVVPVEVQLGLFALVMYAAAYRMFRPATAPRHQSLGAAAVVDCPDGDCGDLPYMQIVWHGVAVGILTGFVGVGGGFLIVPALVLLSGLPMKHAVGTSLSIVALKSMAGFAGYAGAVSIDYALMGGFTAIAITGSLIGSALGGRISAAALQRGFAVFLVLVATYIMATNVSWPGMS
jgi:uncharacterized membrane protein YfcA